MADDGDDLSSSGAGAGGPSSEGGAAEGAARRSVAAATGPPGQRLCLFSRVLQDPWAGPYPARRGTPDHHGAEDAGLRSDDEDQESAPRGCCRCGRWRGRQGRADVARELAGVAPAGMVHRPQCMQLLAAFEAPEGGWAVDGVGQTRGLSEVPGAVLVGEPRPVVFTAIDVDSVNCPMNAYFLVKASGQTLAWLLVLMHWIWRRPYAHDQLAFAHVLGIGPLADEERLSGGGTAPLKEYPSRLCKAMATAFAAHWGQLADAEAMWAETDDCYHRSGKNPRVLPEIPGIAPEVKAACPSSVQGSSLDCMERLAEVLVQVRSEAASAGADLGSEEELVPLCRRLLEGRDAQRGGGGQDALRAALLLLDALTIGRASSEELDEEAERAHADCVRRHGEVLGPGDPATLELTFRLAGRLAGRGEEARAEEVLRGGREAAAQRLGQESGAALSYDDELAVLLAGTGQAAAAEPLFRHVLEARRGSLGPMHEDDTLRSAHNLAVLLDSTGRRAEAGKLYRSVHADRAKALGDAHPKTVEAAYNLAVHLDACARDGPAAEGERAGAEAAELFRAAHGHLVAQFGPEDERKACAARVQQASGCEG
ncbi:unnamed protein product [Prorocentrum cordatum]|uniref:Nephrocystin-3 n=1 Tax=Prorocentrum cordatum TaxID=2364126 RepID=A0ABN9UCR0_9DINO|nr:unnamed protein product [Polarella glacialis]